LSRLGRVFEEEGFGGHIIAGIVDQAVAFLRPYIRQSQPLCGENRPRPHGDQDGIGFGGAAFEIHAAHSRSVNLRRKAGDPAADQPGAVAFCGAHHGARESGGIDDRRRLWRPRRAEMMTCSDSHGRRKLF
jgi:hypothetical protein